MAISVELGPGIRLVAPTRSRKCSRLIQRRLTTTSSSIMAMWAAGPPKAVKPRRRKSAASSFSPPILLFSLLMNRRLFIRLQKRIQGPATCANEEQENGTQQHGEIGAGFVCHRPKSLIHQNGNLGGSNRHQHIDDHRDGGQTAEQSNKNE